MRIVKTNSSWQCAILFFTLVSLGFLATAAWADPPQQPQNPAAAEKEDASAKLRPVRIAIFEMDTTRETGITGPATTDQLNKMLASLPKVTLVNRDQINKVAEEHQMALSGLVNNADAVKLGKFLSAQYIVVGRASKIGQNFYFVLKIVDVETTVQTTVSAKVATESGFEAVLERLEKPLAENVRQLQRPVVGKEDTALAEIRKLAEPLADKVILVSVEESHVGRPLRDPAAQLAVMQRLRTLGFSVIVPTDPVSDWKQTLLKTGMYGEQKVDLLLEGEGTSAFAAQIQGLTSCRARVELRLVPVPGRKVATSDRGVAAGVDLVEALAAKAALEEAGVQACDALVRRAASELKKP